ncbi:DUF4020 domain-containing protein, partial [Priestia megaterium]|uniref:DUF4020 domain-containing protein n=1 Tax=Priestia megaterium TaxID=1404 RepID=UPI002FFE086A
EHFCLNKSEIALCLIESWFLSEIPLLKRLSIHGLLRSNVNSDSKINWVIEKNLLYAYGLKHEVFQLIKSAYPSASYEQKKKLLKNILNGPVISSEKNNEEVINYEIYNLIFWLTLACPDCKLANKYFEELKNKYPTFEPRDNPDLDTWSSVGNIEHLSPLSVDEILEKDIEEVYHLLLTFKGDWFKGPDKEGLLEEVTKAVKENFEWSWKLIDILISKKDTSSDAWRAVFKGWNLSQLDLENWRDIINLLESQKELSFNLKDDIIDIFSNALKYQDKNSFFKVLDNAELLIYEIWKKASVVKLYSHNQFPEGWLTKAINNFGGKSVLFWMHGLSKRIELAKEEGLQNRKLFDSYKIYFNEVLSGNSHLAQLGKVLLASQIHFLYSLDDNWVKEKLLPLLDWSIDPHQAEQAWDGYLSWGRIIGPLLEETISYYEQSYKKLSGPLKHVRDKFCDHMALIALKSEVLQEHHNQQLIKFIGSIEEVDRASWANHLNRYLKMLTSNEAKENIWNNWIKGYWEQRILGVVPLSEQELEGMFHWSLQLEPVFDEVVYKILRSPVPALEYTSFYKELEESKLVEKFPEQVIDLLNYLLSATVDPFYHCSTLENIVSKLKLAINGKEELLRPIRLQLSRLGCNIYQDQ